MAPKKRKGSPTLVDSHNPSPATKPKTNHQISFMSTLRQLKSEMTVLFDDQQYSDLKITCKGTEFHLHRAILFPRCDFFRACFESGFKESNVGTIVLDDDNPDILRMALLELYTRDPSIVRTYFAENTDASLSNLIEAWKLADKYDLNNLTRQCLAYIGSEDGVKVLKDRSPHTWTMDLLIGLVETKTFNVQEMESNYNCELRNEIKSMVMKSKDMSAMTADEKQVLNGSSDVVIELLEFALKQPGKRNTATEDVSGSVESGRDSKSPIDEAVVDSVADAAVAVLAADPNFALT